MTDLAICFQLVKRFIVSIAVGMGVLMSPSASQASDAVRLSWQSFAKDPQNVESLRKAIAVMKAYDGVSPSSPQFRKSWTYWANMHGYFGPDSPFGTVAENQQGVPKAYLKYFKGITDTTPPDQVARDVWAQCQHGTPWFFAWHRLYLYYFEKQLQQASGNANLRLPYWDYTNPSQLDMPAEFAKPTYVDASGKTQANPLYESRRASGWSTGKQSLNQNSTNVDTALKNQKAFTGYQDAIENGVHGYIHCSVSVTCPVTDMGSVPYSSNDPIFWVHHANIDRLWSCWTNIKGNTNPTDPSFLGQQFSFINVNAQEVTNKVSDLFNGSLIDYTYEQEVGCTRTPTAPAAEVKAMDNGKETTPSVAQAEALAMLKTPRSLAVPTKPLKLTKARNAVRVSFEPSEANKNARALALSPNAAAPADVHLVLRGISFKAHPGAMFHVYLQSTTGQKKKVQVGTLSFFALPPGVGKHKEGHHHGSDTLEREFDVTDALRTIGAASSKDVTVSFEVTNGREGDPSVPAINKAADLTVDSIDFQVRLR